MKKLVLFLLATLISTYVYCQPPNFNYQTNLDLRLTHDTICNPFNGTLVTGMGLSGSVVFNSDSSFLRIIVRDSIDVEYLVYEAYPMISDTSRFSFTNECEESCFLNNFIPSRLIIQIKDATIRLNNISWSDSQYSDILLLQKIAKHEKDSLKILKLSNFITKNRLIWKADQTSSSKLFYVEKKKLWGDKYQTYGFEYYSKGFYSPKSVNNNIIHYGYVDNFDWRNRHKANDPNSPYFDGDNENHTGWITKPVCQSGCWDGNELLCNVPASDCQALGGETRSAATCWIFGAVANVEALVNLYYNQHIDDDLSEQYIACKENNINPGWPTSTLNRIKNEGIPDEACLPYSASLQNCNSLCSSNDEEERVFIQHFEQHNNISDQDIRDYLINYGPITASWMQFPWGGYSHSMLLVGWDVLDEDDMAPVGIDPSVQNEWLGYTYWIYKQSEGPGANDHGFYYMLHWDDVQPTVHVIDPAITTKNRTTADIKCYDKDGDGYYFWGIGPKPSQCPNCPADKDGDDSNPGLGPMDSNGFCTIINTYNASFEKDWNNWKQVDYDDQNWQRHKGPTPTELTGPDAAQDGDYYIYTESSCPGCYPHKQYTIESPPINLSSFCESQIEFYFHQYTYLWGNPDHTVLRFDISYDGGNSWQNNVWSIEGNQGNVWHKQIIRFANTVNKVRFTVITGDEAYSDVALDNITIGPGLHDNTPMIINSITSWSQDQKLYSDLTIESGAILTISNCKISMFNNTKIIVKPGGQLILDGAILTSACYSMWPGIEVWGDYNQSQYTINGRCPQGILIIKNHTLIENAENIAIWRPGYYNTSGGIIQASNSTFRNNRRSVEFISYHNFNPYSPPPQPHLNNYSCFSDCSFEITSSYVGPYPFYAHISMWDVEGIRIRGCRFSNAKTYSSSIARGYGIYTIDAGYSIDTYCNSTAIPCPPTSVLRSSFQGLFAGISALNQSSSNTVYVNKADFNDNSFGMRLNTVNNASAILNAFDVGSNTICPNFTGIGIELNNCTGYTIEQNSFTHSGSSNPGDKYLGIRVIGQNDPNDVTFNQIYNNSLQGITVGNQAEEYNANSTGTTGLYYICNENSNNNYDLYTFGPGVAHYQGSYSKPAGNKFSKNANNPYSDFNNQAWWIITYKYYNGDPLQHPESVYNVITEGTPNQNPCLDNFGGNGIGIEKLSAEQVSSLQTEYAENLTAYSNIKAIYESLKDGGNTSTLESDISTSTPDQTMQLRDELLGRSPHLSREILVAAANKNDVLPDPILFEILAANPEELRNDSLLNYLKNKTNPLPDYMIELLKAIASDSTYKTTLQSGLSYYYAKSMNAAYALTHDILLDTIQDLSNLRNWLDNQHTLSADYQIIDSWFAEKNTTSALALLDLLPQTYSLDSSAMVEYNYYKDFKTFQAGLINTNTNIYQLDSTQLAFLNYTASNSKGMAGDQARNILEFAYGVFNINCPPSPDLLIKSTPFNAAKNLNSVYEPKITVAPNPAGSWTVFNYTLFAGVDNSSIKITDMKNQVIKILPVTSVKGQITWDTRDVPAGLYIYTLMNDKYSKSGKISVVH